MKIPINKKLQGLNLYSLKLEHGEDCMIFTEKDRMAGFMVSVVYGFFTFLSGYIVLLLLVYILAKGGHDSVIELMFWLVLNLFLFVFCFYCLFRGWLWLKRLIWLYSVRIDLNSIVITKSSLFKNGCRDEIVVPCEEASLHVTKESILGRYNLTLNINSEGVKILLLTLVEEKIILFVRDKLKHSQGLKIEMPR